MSPTLRSVVTGVGDFLPEQVVTNDDLAKVIDTSDAWIRERTGIRQRRKAVEGETAIRSAASGGERVAVDPRLA